MTGTLKARVGTTWQSLLGSGFDAAAVARWNTSWGVVGFQEGTSVIPVAAVPTTLATVTFTAVAGRLYRAFYQCVGNFTAAGSVLHVRLFVDGTILADSRQTAGTLASQQMEIDLPCERFAPAAGSHTVTAVYSFPGGGTYFTVQGDYAPWRLVVADVGPVTPASIAPPTAQPRVVASGNSLGIVQMGSFIPPLAGRTITASTGTTLTNGLAFTMTVGRRYRLVFQIRAVNGVGGAASFFLRDNGTDIRGWMYGGDPYVWLDGPYAGINFAWLFDGDGASHSLQVVINSPVQCDVYTDYGQFYLEDVGPNTTPALPIPETPPAWTPLAVNAGWEGTPSYRKLGDMVQLRIASHWSGSGPANPFATLPAGFRPPVGIDLVAGFIDEGGAPLSPFALRLNIAPTGAISLYGLGATRGYFSVNGQQFSITP